MDKKKIEAFVHHILQECEKEGLSISEVERLPQALQFAISDSVAAQIKILIFAVRFQVCKNLLIVMIVITN